MLRDIAEPRHEGRLVKRVDVGQPHCCAAIQAPSSARSRSVMCVILPSGMAAADHRLLPDLRRVAMKIVDSLELNALGWF